MKRKAFLFLRTTFEALNTKLRGRRGHVTVGCILLHLLFFFHLFICFHFFSVGSLF
jgi:hypothetical protein